MLFGTIYVHSVTSATFMAPLSMSPVFLFSGFFSKISTLPLFLKPIAILSYVRYCFENFLISLYGFDRCKISHNKTFFLHRYLHNWTLFQKEKELFFGFKNIELTTTLPPLLPSNAQALIQTNPFNLTLIPESSRSILSSSLPNDLFKNFSSYVDKNLFDKFQANFFKNNSINLPNLLTSTTTESSSISIENSSNYISNFIAQSISSTVAPLPSSSIAEINSFFDNNNLAVENLTSINNLIEQNLTSSIYLLNESEIGQRTFCNLTNSLVLEFYNIDDDIFWKNIMFLTAIFLFLRILAYAILVFKTNRFK